MIPGNGAGRVAFISLGCAKNLVDSEQMMYLLDEAGFEVSGETDGADAVVINTCGFIESAKMEAIETILGFGHEKENGRVGKIIVAGCLPERYRSEIITEMPEVDAIVGVGGFGEIVKTVSAVLGNSDRSVGSSVGSSSKPEVFGDINAPVSDGKRIITTPKAWAYLKIAEGCDNRCAFCVIPDIRGRFRSRSIESISSEAQTIAERGAKELIIVAQDVTRYGLDLYGTRRLPDLLAALSSIKELEWIRLHYLYPDETDDAIIRAVAENGKILKYLDIPVQHINDSILSRMRRRGTGREIRELFKRLREQIPGVVLRSSLITGLPGEGVDEFEELCAFLRETGIERAGVFPYSPEEGTDAAQMIYPDRDTAEHRAEIVAEIQRQVMDEFNIKRIGSVTPVLIEWASGSKYFGRSYAESPDVDGYIQVSGAGAAVGDIVNVMITGIEEGVIIS